MPWRQSIAAWLYVGPAMLIVALMFFLPVILALWMSLHEWPLLGPPAFNAPTNYLEIPTDELFLRGIRFTISYTAIITPALLSLALVMALLVQEARRGVGLLRTIYFLPAVIGLTASALLFYGLYSESIGPLNPVLVGLGVIETPIDWLGTPTNALLSTVILMVWRFSGFYMLILLTGLNSIPVQLFEAAKIDGASPVQTFRFVTLPLLRPSIALCLILMVTGALLAFEQFYVLTRGGPDNSTVTMVMAMFRQAFSHFNLGRASALAAVVLLALVAINAIQLRLIRREA